MRTEVASGCRPRWPELRPAGRKEQPAVPLCRLRVRVGLHFGKLTLGAVPRADPLWSLCLISRVGPGKNG